MKRLINRILRLWGYHLARLPGPERRKNLALNRMVKADREYRAAIQQPEGGIE